MQRFRNELALDSNLLLLLTVESFEPRTLRSFKRPSSFVEDDLKLLQEITASRKLIVTPHLLTEVSNVANGLPELLRLGFLRYLCIYIPGFSEVFADSTSLCRDRAFALFGLTDAAICSLAAHSLIITEDRRLQDYLKRQGRTAFNITDLRELRSNQANKVPSKY